MKIRRVIMHTQGGPEVMQFEETDLAAPAAGQAQVEITAIGLNYMDIYQRSGAYKVPLPSPLGLEAAGRVIAVGDGVSEVAVGDRVAYCMIGGAYATHVNVPAARLVKLPDAIPDDVAAAVLLKGMTAEYLINRTFKVQKGMDVLFWAASGGVGQLAGQWGAHIGARMIGVTSGPENCKRILQLGYAEAIDRKSEDVAKRVRDLTGGKGVPVVYDSIGKASFEATIDSLATFGYFVLFGATSGQAPDMPAHVLQTKGSLYYTRPTLADYVKAREDLVESAARVFKLVADGVLTVNIDQRMPLDQVVDAHKALEKGETTGSTVLTP